MACSNNDSNTSKWILPLYTDGQCLLSLKQQKEEQTTQQGEGRGEQKIYTSEEAQHRITGPTPVAAWSIDWQGERRLGA